MSEERLVCTGHQELREIAIETRNDVRHLTEEIRAYTLRKEREDDIIESRISYLELNGAKISQKNAEDLINLSKEFAVLKQGWGEMIAVQRFWDSWITKTALVIGIAFGIASLILQIAPYLLGGH